MLADPCSNLGVGNTKLPVLFQMRNPRFKGSDSSFQPNEKRKWKFQLRLQWHARYQNELEKSHLEKSCQKQGELFNSELLNCSTPSGKCHMTLKEGCRGFLSRRNSDALPSASWRRNRSHSCGESRDKGSHSTLQRTLCSSPILWSTQSEKFKGRAWWHTPLIQH